MAELWFLVPGRFTDANLPETKKETFKYHILRNLVAKEERKSVSSKKYEKIQF